MVNLDYTSLDRLIIDYVRENPQSSCRDVAGGLAIEGLEISEARVNNRLRALARDGWMERTGVPTGGYIRYAYEVIA